MTHNELVSILAKGETATVEFSSIANIESAAKSVCAFLNTSGGRLFLGVDDKGRILGIQNAMELVPSLHSELSSRISPRSAWTIDPISSPSGDVLLVEVPSGQDKPYVAMGAIYLRRRKHTVAANRDEISDLIQKRTESSHRWERQLALGADRLDLDDELVRETMAKATEAQRWKGIRDDIDGFLNDLGLAEEGKITNACLLLYGNTPSRVLPQARVRLLVLPGGKTADRYAVDRLFEASLLRIAKELPEALNLYIGGVESRFTAQDWVRSDKPLYPAAALREGLMNALIHRDYDSNAAITISIDPVSLKISNPGSLPDQLKPADLKRDHLSIPRNPDVAHVCFLHGLIEKIGRGTQRILTDCQELDLPQPKWQTSKHETNLTFFTRRGPDARSSEELNDRQKKILALLEQRGQLSSTEIVAALGAGVTDRTIRTDLQTLQDQGLLRRKGKGRATVLLPVKNA